jgi:hypothetical protein
MRSASLLMIKIWMALGSKMVEDHCFKGLVRVLHTEKAHLSSKCHVYRMLLINNAVLSSSVSMKYVQSVN